jgi:hypothetical protein
MLECILSLCFFLWPSRKPSLPSPDLPLSGIGNVWNEVARDEPGLSDDVAGDFADTTEGIGAGLGYLDGPGYVGSPGATEDLGRPLISAPEIALDSVLFQKKDFTLFLNDIAMRQPSFTFGRLLIDTLPNRCIN